MRGLKNEAIRFRRFKSATYNDNEFVCPMYGIASPNDHRNRKRPKRPQRVGPPFLGLAYKS
jgi:hypothetical protein